ncbi:MAG: DNA gyrase subunit A [Muribaculaceae bacterium]|nr:DNA gyrase subunit A [Muribaculaceae bacterium]
MLEEDRIFKINIENEMKSAYIDYSMSVIVSRALPDVRDGMKPVHRRVLFGMNEMGNTSDKPHKKAANCVGEVMGKYHPHGDSSIYGTVVRMAQDWSLRYTLVDGHGNFGSIDGDGPAAMRYTEVRLAKMGEEMLRDLDSDTVDFQPNYDNSRREPTVLPTRFPNLLVNGASGIAVGMATNMPPHNLTESINASIALLENPDITTDDLLRIIPAPDFPTGGTIYGYDGVREAYETGRGRVIIRANATIEQEQNHETIIVHEIPYGVNKAELIKYIAELVTDKKLDGIADINDESDAEGMRIVIKLRSDANSNVVLNKLYKMTQMQSSFAVNNVALVHGRPKTLSLKEILQAFIDHRHEVVIRRTRYKLAKAQERAHILEGLIIASDNIDEVIQIIRNTTRDEDPREKLKERFGLSDAQAQAVVDMQLKRLSGLEQDKLHAQYKEVEEEIAGYELILSDENVCREVIRKELEDVRDTYGDERKTVIDYKGGSFNAEAFYPDDDVIITISHLGYIKRTPLSEYRAQHRGGVGSRGAQTRDEDFIEHIYTASMHCSMLFFTDRGLVYKLKVYELPEATKTSKGRALQNLLNIEPGDKVRAYLACKQLEDPEFAGSHYLIFATRRGIVKKTALSEYSRVLAKGKKAILIREGDSLIGVDLTDDTSDILLAARKGKANRFRTDSLRTMGRVSSGVRGMRLSADNEVVGLITMTPDSDNTVLVVSEKGYGKRTALDAYRLTSRGSMGVKTLNVTDRTGELIAFESVNDDNDLVIINRSGMLIRIRVADIKIAGRATQGVRLINLDKRGDEIASVCAVPTDPEEEVEKIDGEELPELDITAETEEEPDTEPDDDADDTDEAGDDNSSQQDN